MSRLNYPAFIIFSAIIMYSNNAAINAHSDSVSPISKQWTADYENYKPNIVAIKDRVLHVGLHENVVNLTSTDGVLVNVCNFTLSPDKIVKPNIVRPVALGNGKIVVRTMMSQVVTTYQSPTDSQVWDLFIIVDPLDCTSTKTVEVYNKGWKRDVAAVVPYQDSFDVFYRKSSANNDTSGEVFKTPRRFNDQAAQINLEHRLDLEADIVGFHIDTVKPYDASEGYVCTLASKTDNTMLLKRLDSRFQLVKETKVEPWANVMSVADDSVSLCYITANLIPQTLRDEKNLYKYAVTCSLFDVMDLTRRATVRLHEPEIVNDKVLKPEVIKVVKLPGGATVAAIAFKHSGMSENKGYTTDYYLQRINADGSTAEAVHVGTYTNFFDLMSLVSLGGGEVCLAVVGEVEPRFGYKNMRINVTSKCFNMLK
ncbi:hypothetical protein TSAR_013058 [Trichomalopsis sarcophagae]|uniref:Uncharacterized protein n=1 Tax=Trichomalopsis sarcophagae TaxID=543379 RepID=A0A232EPH7_9HYME|nr:hypothetical protein TSAR_013058 [Trichomalopsis sarcophagae]